MLDLLGTVFASILSGGATGIVGVIAQRVADYKNRQLDIQAQQSKQAHEVAMRRADAEIMAQEWAARTKVAEVEVAGRSDVADSQAFAASFNEPARYSEGVKPSRGQGWVLVLLDALRGAVRPVLTVYLCVLTTLVYMQAREMVGNGLTAAEAMALVKMVVGTILYLTTTCVLWWFGTRNKGKPPVAG
jgi:hypothetical protein